jgi:hypothetical protein
MKLIYVEWEDAAGVHHWQPLDDALDWAANNNTLIRQVGWVIEENPRYIVLVGRLGRAIFDSDEEDDVSVGMVQKIPKTWIRKRKAIKL